jgi:hypothetical protein
VQGFQKPQRFYTGVWRVGVRVQIFRPSKNPYPSEGSKGTDIDQIRLKTQLQGLTFNVCAAYRSLLDSETPGVLMKGMRGKDNSTDLQTLQNP